MNACFTNAHNAPTNLTLNTQSREEKKQILFLACLSFCLVPLSIPLLPTLSAIPLQNPEDVCLVLYVPVMFDLFTFDDTYEGKKSTLI